ncbi:hypothetical protein [Micromonospora sp. CMU55-4]|uniref:hypothetical protein n=1 Tax=Micromonospora sp. CMU55-4 TaxID=2717028 RepID=UPI0014077250|nr:hypothetical protein [Micromonospora sp. CMU55-4]NHO83152.1 hypothetical protein [Micromonospora sp. CMU55-4]
MHTLPWERTSRIAEVGDQIWSYVSPAARLEGPGLLVAAALLGWPGGDVAKLGALQFLLSAEVREFVQQLPELARRLSTTSVRGEERSAERVRGAVHWGQTMTGRLTSGSPHLHVTAPVDRAYQTPENELLVHVLDAVANLATASGWHLPSMRSEPATTIRSHLDEATKWQTSSMLATIERIPPTSRSLARIAAGRTGTRYRSVLAAYGKLNALVERLDRAEVRRAIEEVGLVTAQEHILFELLTLFRVMASLGVHGWELQPLRLFRGAVETHGTSRDGRRIDLWYQSKPSVLADVSNYREVLARHGFQRPQDLRPDLVLHWQTPTGSPRTLVIECKLSTSGGVKEAARSALFDLLAYRQAFASSMAGAGVPYGLGVAWGGGLTPQLNQDVMLCTPDKIEEALLTTASG